MFEVGFWELTLIAVIALLVIGPERLPRVARDVGMWVGRIRRYVNHVRDDIEREIRSEELKRTLGGSEALDDLKDAVAETKDALSDARRKLESASDSVKQEAESFGRADAAAAPAIDGAGAEPATSSTAAAGVDQASNAPSPAPGDEDERPAPKP